MQIEDSSANFKKTELFILRKCTLNSMLHFTNYVLEILKNE